MTNGISCQCSEESSVRMLALLFPGHFETSFIFLLLPNVASSPKEISKEIPNFLIEEEDCSKYQVLSSVKQMVMSIIFELIDRVENLSSYYYRQEFCVTYQYQFPSCDNTELYREDLHRNNILKNVNGLSPVGYFFYHYSQKISLNSINLPNDGVTYVDNKYSQECKYSPNNYEYLQNMDTNGVNIVYRNFIISFLNQKSNHFQDIPITKFTKNILSDIYYKAYHSYENQISFYCSLIEKMEYIKIHRKLVLLTKFVNIGSQFIKYKYYNNALYLYYKIFDIFQSLFGKKHWKTTTMIRNIAGIYYSIKKYEEAISLYKYIITLEEKVKDDNDEIEDKMIFKKDNNYYYDNQQHIWSCRNNIASCYYEIKNYDEALFHFKKGLDLNMLKFGYYYDKEIFTCINNMICIYTIRKQYEELISLYILGLDMKKIQYGENNIETIIYMKKLADLYYQFNDDDNNNIQNRQKAILLYEKYYNNKKIVKTYNKHDELISVIDILIMSYDNNSRYKDTIPLYYDIYLLYMELFGCMHTETIHSLFQLIDLHESFDHIQECMTLYTSYLELYHNSHGEMNEDILSMMNNLANIYYDLELYEDAYVQYYHCMESCFQVFGEYHSNNLIVLDNLIDLSSSMQRYDDLIVFLEKYIKISSIVSGESHPNTMHKMVELAEQYEIRMKYQEALLLYIKYFELLYIEVDGDESNINMIKILDNIGKLHEKMNSYEDAIHLYKKLFKIKQQLYGENHDESLDSIKRLGSMYEYKGNFNKAKLWYSKCIEIQLMMNGSSHQDTVESILQLGRLCERTKSYVEAISIYSKYNNISKGIQPRLFHTIKCMDEFAQELMDTEKFDMALPLLTKSYEMKSMLLGEMNSDTLLSANNLGCIYAIIGRDDDAYNFFKKCYHIRLDLLGEGHDDTLLTFKNLTIIENRKNESSKCVVS